MVAVIDAVTHKIANYAKFIDVVLCTWIHNPILASTMMLLLALLFLALQIRAAASPDLFSQINFNDYLLDFLHNAVNLLFVVRFPAASKRGLTIESSTFGECVLLAIQNAGCAALLLCPLYSLLYSNVHQVLKGLMLWQIVCPYLILFMFVFESKWTKFCGTEKQMELPSKLLIRSLLIDTNNNLLPIFMAHSFAAINFDFPLAGSFWPLLAYKLANFSFKFYLINRYVLYELVMVISDVSNLKSYAELYMPVMIGEKQKKWYNHVARHTSAILTGCCALLMGLDAGFMAIALMK